MSKPRNPPAFPTPRNQINQGMTLRDWFAGQAIIALLHDNPPSRSSGNPAPAHAAAAYMMADAMLAERERDQ